MSPGSVHRTGFGAPFSAADESTAASRMTAAIHAGRTRLTEPLLSSWRALSRVAGPGLRVAWNSIDKRGTRAHSSASKAARLCLDETDHSTRRRDGPPGKGHPESKKEHRDHDFQAGPGRDRACPDRCGGARALR